MTSNFQDTWSRDQRPPIEYDNVEFKVGDVVINVSTSKQRVPRMSFAVGRFTRDGATSRWLPWNAIDDVIKALEALKTSPHAAEAKRIAELRQAQLRPPRNSTHGWQREDPEDERRSDRRRRR